MTELDDEDDIEPPITNFFPIDQLKLCVETRKTIVFEILYGKSCHTQSVERAIRLVCERSQKVFTEENRNHSIYNKIACTKILPKTNTKADNIDFVD